MQNIIIYGATSAIAQETARLFASKDRCRFILIGRHIQRLDTLCADLMAYGAKSAQSISIDFTDVQQLELSFGKAVDLLGGSADAVLLAHGALTDQAKADVDIQYAAQDFSFNTVAFMIPALAAANYFEKKGSGMIAGISSVAGERGRKGNYIYGAAKSACTAFLSGLRGRLYPEVKVLTIKPGFVSSPMTAHLPQNALFASAQKAGIIIYTAMKNGDDIVYVPGFWQYIMLIIRLIPETFFKRLSI
jgi:short-subunit dehydrogenase